MGYFSKRSHIHHTIYVRKLEEKFSFLNITLSVNERINIIIPFLICQHWKEDSDLLLKLRQVVMMLLL